MKVEKLNENSVQIEFSAAEIAQRAINVRRLTIDAPAYKKLLRDLISHAEIELGASIGAVRVNTYQPDDPAGLGFVLENITSAGGTEAGVNDPPGRRTETAEAPKLKKDSAPLAGVPQKSAAKPAELTASGEAQPANSANAAGIDLAEALMRKIMFDGLMSIQAAAAGAQNARRARGRGERQSESVDDDIALPPLESNAGDEPDSLADTLDYRRQMLFGEDYKTQGGVAVVAFAIYDELYEYFREHRGFGTVKSALYEYRDIFYAVLEAGPEQADKLELLDNTAGEFRGALVPGRSSLTVLKEYATVIFAKNAVRKIRASLGE
ncbi:MAG: adaptor protein MecA [Clostridia bacterium]|nr:adaptor protein MecA [Clostridia bacterium]